MRTKNVFSKTRNVVKDHETMVEGREKIEGADQSKARPNTRTRNVVEDHETMMEGWEKIEGTDQSTARPNTGKSRATGIGRHPLNRAPVGEHCGEETVWEEERRGERVAVGIPEEFVAAEDRDDGCGVGQP